MKLTIESSELRGLRCVRAKATINKSVKKGILRRFQKNVDYDHRGAGIYQRRIACLD